MSDPVMNDLHRYLDDQDKDDAYEAAVERIMDDLRDEWDIEIVFFPDHGWSWEILDADSRKKYTHIDGDWSDTEAEAKVDAAKAFEENLRAQAVSRLEALGD